MSGRFACCRCMAAATVTWGEIASCGRKRVVVGKDGEDGEGLVACGIEGCGRRRGGVWRSVGCSVCGDDGVCDSGMWRSGVGWDVIVFQCVA